MSLESQAIRLYQDLSAAGCQNQSPESAPNPRIRLQPSLFFLYLRYLYFYYLYFYYPYFYYPHSHYKKCRAALLPSARLFLRIPPLLSGIHTVFSQGIRTKSGTRPISLEIKSDILFFSYRFNLLFSFEAFRPGTVRRYRFR